jgi:hypothetical protein
MDVAVGKIDRRSTEHGRVDGRLPKFGRTDLVDSSHAPAVSPPVAREPSGAVPMQQGDLANDARGC